MTDIEFVRISNYLKSKFGIDMTAKKEIMDGRLTNMLTKRGYADYTQYMNAVEADPSGMLEKELVNLLSTNHTYFMREFDHLDYLRTVILPQLKISEDRTKDLRIWCGASSSGEEPYMIAMTCMDFFGLEKKLWDTKVLATDISTEVLQTATKGIYSREAIEKLPVTWQRRYFRMLPGGENYQATDELRDEVLFRQFNLMNPFPFRHRMHVIFLRNVMIYFDQRTKSELLNKVYQFLEPGGYLFVGKTETIDRSSLDFELVGPSIFRKPL